MGTIICGNCLDILPTLSERVDCVFADPPDNIGLAYTDCHDRRPDAEYVNELWDWVNTFVGISDVVWLSFNAKWTIDVALVAATIRDKGYEVRPCVQTFTFYQHRKSDLGNAHRPLWRFRRRPFTGRLNADDIRVESWRQANGDKRAAEGGKVPGDVFDFPRVTGNSRQRRGWHPTQLHEGLVERCIRLTTKPGDVVLDPFAGTGTVLRVCNRIGRHCISIDVSPSYCNLMASENGFRYVGNDTWADF